MRPFEFGIRKVEGLAKRLSWPVAPDDKRGRATLLVREMTRFRRSWRTQEWGKLEEVLAVMALRRRLAFNPRASLTTLFVRIVLGCDPKAAKNLAKAMDQVESGEIDEKTLNRKGVHVAAWGERDTT